MYKVPKIFLVILRQFPKLSKNLILRTGESRPKKLGSVQQGYLCK